MTVYGTRKKWEEWAKLDLSAGGVKASLGIESALEAKGESQKGKRFVSIYIEGGLTPSKYYIDEHVIGRATTSDGMGASMPTVLRSSLYLYVSTRCASPEEPGYSQLSKHEDSSGSYPLVIDNVVGSTI
ncbi:hypothetical protein LTR49_028585 [Elasticomyces elasticus]|nr:hypothetical protein LTR49_028585 [Elasticomyces elasticus]